MTATRDDVARLAKVSSATVSYVINDGPRPVSDETKTKVLEAIHQLGYQPNAVARNLRMQRTFTIGLVIPDTHNPYFAEVVSGIEETAFNNGYKVILLHSSYNTEKEFQFVELLRTERVDGVIWIPASSNVEPLKELALSELPTVVFDRVGAQADLQALVTDNYHGGYLATRHLIELGHKRIGYISRPVELSHSQGRLRGYMDALAEAQIPFDPELIIKGGFLLDDGRRALFSLLDLPCAPTGVFTYNDMMAIGVLRGAFERGLNVPKDLSVVGFDDISQAAFTCPALTTIHLDKFEMGRRSAILLMALINKEIPDPKLTQPAEVRLITRETTGVAPPV